MTNPKYRESILWKLFFAKDTPKAQQEFNKKIIIKFMNGGILGNIGLQSLEETRPTCGVCQAMCVADPKQRKTLVHNLQTSGTLFVDAQGREIVRKVDEGKSIDYIPPTKINE